MPYITKEAREEIDSGKYKPILPGELNYAITRLLKQYMDKHGVRYQTINDILGALEGAKLEFYRRVAVPYEAGKIAENGDVY
jgi:hypothetical protein